MSNKKQMFVGFMLGLLLVLAFTFMYKQPVEATVCQPLPFCLFSSPQPSPSVSPRPSPRVSPSATPRVSPRPSYSPRPSVSPSAVPSASPSVEPSPRVDPSPSPCTENCSTPPQNHEVVYTAPICTGNGPKKPTLHFLGSANGCAYWRVDQTDQYDYATFNYGYSSGKLEYGIPKLSNQSKEFDTCGLQVGAHVWGQVCTVRDNQCGECSDIVDPVVQK